MAFFFDLAVVVAIVYAVARIAASVALPDRLLVAVLVVFLIGGVILRAWVRAAGGALRMLFTVGMPVLSFYLLVSGHAQGGERFPLAVMLIALFLSLVGIYVTAFGAFSSPRGILWNLPALLSIMAFVVGLAMRGYLPPEDAALFMIALVFVKGVGSLFGPRVAQTTRAAYALLVPLTALILMVLLATGEGLPAGPALGFAGLLLALAVVLFLYSRRYFAR